MSDPQSGKINSTCKSDHGPKDNVKPKSFINSSNFENADSEYIPNNAKSSHGSKNSQEISDEEHSSKKKDKSGGEKFLKDKKEKNIMGKKHDSSLVSKEKESNPSEEQKIKEYKAKIDPYYAKKPDIQNLMYCEVKPAFKGCNLADVCLICDITGSMDIYIEKIKDIFIDFIKNVYEITCHNPRMSFIGFRDKLDEERLVVKDFSNDYMKILEGISKIQCDGGGDYCEDAVTPLREALNLKWKSELRYVYLLLEAPTHGLRYHDETDIDDYPEDEDNRMLEKLMGHYRKCHINLIVIKCNNSVNKMIEIMKKYYDSSISKLLVINLPTEPNLMKQGFNKNFVDSVAKSFQQSMYRNFKKINRQVEAPEVIDENPEFIFEQRFIGKIFTGILTGLMYEKQIYNYKFTMNESAEMKFKMSAAKIGAGMFSNCYTLEAEDDEKYVGKVPKVPVKSVKELNFDIEGNTFTIYMSRKFNSIFKEKLINVLPVISIEILDNDLKIFKGSKAILAQRYLEGKYTKYNNNYGWVNKQRNTANLIAQAFSHFTYECSMGTFIVVDIQGVSDSNGQLTITDPAIHSTYYSKRFGETNHGKIGIVKFFQSHVCNNFCKELKLLDPNKIDNNKLEELKKVYKDNEHLSHLYEKLKEVVKESKNEIKNFDENLEPYLPEIKEESDDDEDLGKTIAFSVHANEDEI